jgi:hypothetical protein
MMTIGKNCNDINEGLRDLKASFFDKEKKSFMRDRRDVERLYCTCYGKIAKVVTRNQFAGIIEKYIAINHNAVTGTTPVKLDANPIKRRKQVDVKMAKIELENQQLAISNQTMAYELYAMACPDGKPDDIKDNT